VSGGLSGEACASLIPLERSSAWLCFEKSHQTTPTTVTTPLLSVSLHPCLLDSFWFVRRLFINCFSHQCILGWRGRTEAGKGCQGLLVGGSGQRSGAGLGSSRYAGR